jgi:hypothetical protein
VAPTHSPVFKQLSVFFLTTGTLLYLRFTLVAVGLGKPLASDDPQAWPRLKVGGRRCKGGGVEAMARLLLFVSMVVYLGVAAVLLRDPAVEFFRTYIAERVAETRSRPARSTVRPPLPKVSTSRVSAESSVAPSALSLETSSSQSRMGTPSTYVLTSAAPVYSSNSADGSLLKELQEGDQVEAGLNVLTAEGLWIQIKLDEETSGFVRGEDLSRD